MIASLPSFVARPPTARQAQVLRFIAASIVERGYPPTRHEIGDALGLASTCGVQDHIKRLERRGLIRRSRMVSRGLVLTDAGRAFIASQADAPIEAPTGPAPASAGGES